MATKARRASGTPPFECIALLLQGGSARLYQASVYAARRRTCNHWVAGISIGAISGALIAGNVPSAC